MEEEEVASSNSIHSPRPAQGFLNNRYLRKSLLSIPDTIQEQSFVNSSNNSEKMETQETITECPVDDEEKTTCDSSVKTESSSASTVIGVDNCYVKNLEEELLDSDSDKESIASENEFKNGIPIEKVVKKLGLDATVSTPPTMLRKEISILRSELDEAHEFHDLEIQILNEENYLKEDMHSQNYCQILEKYTTLLDLYTSLKDEYEKYRKKQESLQLKTTVCFETLCSEIEASDSSINLSTTFDSLNADIKSSTMVKDIEIEANDSLTWIDTPSKTTPLRSIRHLFNLDLKNKTPLIKQVLLNKSIESERRSQLLDIETALNGKIKELEDLGERMFKVEDLVSVLVTEQERIAEELTKESKTLKENLENKTKELDALTDKLFTEIICLNPALKDTIVDHPSLKLLTIFIETIMESCQNSLKKFTSEKSDWENKCKEKDEIIENLQNQIESLNNQESSELKELCEDLKKQISEAKNLISTKDEKIKTLESRENGDSSQEIIMKLESQILENETKRNELEKQVQDLEAVTTALKDDLQARKVRIEELEKDILSYLRKNGELDEVICGLKSDLELANHDKKYLELQLKNEINEHSNKDSQLEELQKENESLKSQKECNQVLNEEIKLLKNNKENLMGLLLDIQATLEIPSETFSEIMSGCFENRKIFIDKINKIQAESLENEKKAKEEVTETLRNLESQLVEIEHSKKETEAKNQTLKEVNEKLEGEVEIKSSIIDELERSLESYKRQVEELQQAVEKSMEEISSLKKELTEVRELEVELHSERVDNNNTKMQLEEKIKEVSCATERIAVLEEKEKTLSDILSEIQESVEVPSDVVERLLSGSLEDRKFLCEKINKLAQDFTFAKEKVELENKIRDVEAARIETELDNKKLHESLEEFSAAKNRIEILQARIDEVEIEKQKLRETLTRLEGSLEEEKSTKEKLETQISEVMAVKNVAEVEKEKLREALTALEMNFKELESKTETFHDALQEKTISLEKSLQDFAAAEERIKELEAKVEEGNICNQKLQEIIATLESNLDVASNQKSEFEIDNQKLQEKVKRLQELEAEVSAKTETNTKLKESLTGLESLLADNNSSLEKAKAQISEIERENQNLRENLTAMESSLEGFTSAIERIKELETRVSEVLSVKNEVETENQNLKEKLTQMESNLSGFSSAIEKVKELEAQICEDKDKAEIKNRELLSTLEESLKNVAVANERIKELETQMSSVMAAKAKTDTENQKLQEIITALKQIETRIPEALRCETESETQKPKGTLTAIENTLQAYNLAVERITELETKFAEVVASQVETEIKNRELVSNLEGNFVSAKERIKELEDQISDALAAKSEAEVEKEKINETVTALESDLESAKERVRELVGRIQEVESVKSEIETHNQILQESIATLQRTLEERVSEIQNEKQKLQETLDELEEKNHRVESEKTEISQKLEECQVALSTATEKINELETRLDEAESINQKLQETVTNLNTSLEEFTFTKEIVKKLEAELSEAKSSAEVESRKLRENIIDLESRLERIEELKTQMSDTELLNQKLQETVTSLKTALEAKDIQIRDFENLTSSYLSDNEQLKQVIDSLKSELRIMREEQENKGLKLEELAREIDVIRNEKQELILIADEIKTLENKSRLLIDVVTEIQTCLDLPSDTIAKLLSGKNRKVFTEAINTLQKSKMDCVENEIKIRENLASVLETKAKLESQVAEAEAAKKEIEIQSRKLEEIAVTLQEEIESKKNLFDALEKSLAAHASKNEELKHIIQELENAVSGLKTNLENSEREHRDKDSKMEEMQKRINQLEAEKKCLGVVMEKIESIKNRGNLVNALDELQSGLKLLGSTTSEVLCSFIETISEAVCEFAKEKIELQSKTIADARKIDILLKEVESLKEKLIQEESKFTEMENFCQDLKNQLTETENKKIYESESELEITKSKVKKAIDGLKADLKLAKEEQKIKDAELEKLLKENTLLETVQAEMNSLSSKVKLLETNKQNLTDIISDIQSCLDMPNEILSECLSGKNKNHKVFTEKINILVKSQRELKVENQNLKLGNGNLKEKVKELNKLIGEVTPKEDASAKNSQSMSLRSKSGRNSDLCARRLDKLEEINHNLTMLLMRILTMTEFPNVDTLQLSSVRDYPSISKKVIAHFNNMEARVKELTESNKLLDEECDSYAETIKELKREAVTVWKSNKQKVDELEGEVSMLKEEKRSLEVEKEDLLSKISKLDANYQKLKSGLKPEGAHSCNCGNEMKKLSEMKRTLLIKEQKIMELKELETQNISYKSQIKYLGNALEQEKKKIKEEKEKSRKLQNELNEIARNQKTDNPNSEENQMLDELRMRGTLSKGVVQEFMDGEKMRKLSKDIGILKELCRARYAEIKRLEKENATLKNATSKNSNQMDSPIRTRAYNTRSKNFVKEIWKPELSGKENAECP